MLLVGFPFDQTAWNKLLEFADAVKQLIQSDIFLLGGERHAINETAIQRGQFEHGSNGQAD